MSVADTPRSQPFWLRAFLAIPVLGWIVRDLIFGDKDNIWYALITFVSLWLSAILIFGIPGLYLPALAMVPVIFVVLLLITWA